MKTFLSIFVILFFVLFGFGCSNPSSVSEPEVPIVEPEFSFIGTWYMWTIEFGSRGENIGFIFYEDGKFDYWTGYFNLTGKGQYEHRGELLILNNFNWVITSPAEKGFVKSVTGQYEILYIEGKEAFIPHIGPIFPFHDGGFIRQLN